MSVVYKPFFGFKKDPFGSDIPTKELLRLASMVGVKERIDYSIALGGIMVVTGEVGSGKSTSLRWSSSHYHPSETCIINVVANSGSIVEILKLISWSLDLNPTTTSKAKLTTEVKLSIQEIVSSRKQKVVLMIDEANLMRADVFAEIHTLTQFEHDSKNFITLVLCGQTSLMDRLSYRSSAPLASRVIARTHLETLQKAELEEYLLHHLKIAGVKKNVFSPSATTAIYQGSGGVLRKTNSLARGGLIAAAIEKKEMVSEEHIRIAASEII